MTISMTLGDIERSF